jgi:translation initiation factor 3 subunit M
MPAPSTTLLIEGSFSELSEEFAAYLDALNKSEDSPIQTELAPLLQPLREQEQNDTQIDQSKRDEVLKKLVGSAAVLSTAPEKGAPVFTPGDRIFSN